MPQSSQKQIKQPQTRDSTGLVTLVSQEEFLEFIAAPCAIIQTGDGATPGAFPFAITLRFGFFHVPPVRLGVVDLSGIDWNANAKLYVRFNLTGVNLQPDGLGRPPAGFYLFAGGELVGFHSGEIDLDRDGDALGIGVLAGVFGLLARSPELTHLGLHAATWKAGERVAEAFAEWLQQSFTAQSANTNTEAS